MSNLEADIKCLIKQLDHCLYGTPQEVKKELKRILDKNAVCGICGNTGHVYGDTDGENCECKE